MRRLGSAALPHLTAAVERPTCEPTRHRVGIGVGAFHRIHQAVYTDAALEAGADWRIEGINLRGQTAAEWRRPRTASCHGPGAGGSTARTVVV